MVSRHILQSYLISLMIVMAQAGSKAGKNGKGGSGGGRWNGNLRPKPWNPRDKWSSPDSWSSRTKKSKDSKSDDYDDSGSDDKRKPMCSLANPVEEQIDIIEAPWKAAYLPNNANANVIKTEEKEIAWHANLLMNKFMEIVEDYDDGSKATFRWSLFVFTTSFYLYLFLTLTTSACRLRQGRYRKTGGV